jgi:DUF1680 family protein
MRSTDGIFVNLYSESRAEVALTEDNRVRLEQHTNYPQSGRVTIEVSPETEEDFAIFLRIPGWSKQTTVWLNGEEVSATAQGSYQRIGRRWKRGDRIELALDMRGRLLHQDHHLAIMRGPIALARDSRFGDGPVDQALRVQHVDGYVDLELSGEKPEEVWMAFTAPVKPGTGTKATLDPPVRIRFCDFASAGNTWDKSNRYRVWLPEALDVRLPSSGGAP